MLKPRQMAGDDCVRCRDAMRRAISTELRFAFVYFIGGIDATFIHRNVHA